MIENFKRLAHSLTVYPQKLFRFFVAWLRHLGPRSSPFWNFAALLLWAFVFLQIAFLLNALCENIILLFGWVFQIIGICIVGYGLMGRSKFFGQEILAPLVSWWNNRPRFSPRKIVASAYLSEGRDTMSVRGHVWTTSNPSDPLEVRISAAEKNILQLRKDLARAESSLDKVKGQIEQQYPKLKGKIEEGQNKIENQLRSFALKDIRMELAGVIYLLLGVSMATLSAEISGWFGRC